MKKIQYIQSWLLIIILALSVHGVADAKLAPASISFSSVTHHGIEHTEQQKYHYDATANIQYCCSEYVDKALQEKFQDRFVVAFTRYGNATKGGRSLGKFDRQIGAVGNVRKKPGSLGQPKGTDALRRENKVARDAAQRAGGLTKDQQKILHKEISGQGLEFNDIVDIAKGIKNGGI